MGAHVGYVVNKAYRQTQQTPHGVNMHAHAQTYARACTHTHAHTRTTFESEGMHGPLVCFAAMLTPLPQQHISTPHRGRPHRDTPPHRTVLRGVVGHRNEHVWVDPLWVVLAVIVQQRRACAPPQERQGRRSGERKKNQTRQSEGKGERSAVRVAFCTAR